MLQTISIVLGEFFCVEQTLNNTMVRQLIKKETRMKDFENQIIDRGGGTTTYVANFRSKSGTPFEKSMFTKE
jgi:hypothetical protein